MSIAARKLTMHIRVPAESPCYLARDSKVLGWCRLDRQRHIWRSHDVPWLIDDAAILS